MAMQNIRVPEPSIEPIDLSGGYNVQRSKIFSAQECQNLYLMKDPVNESTALYPYMGAKKITDFPVLNPDFKGRAGAMTQTEQDMYAVVGDRFFRISPSLVFNEIATIATEVGPIAMEPVGEYITFCDQAEQYKYNILTDAFSVSSSVFRPLNPSYLTEMKGYVLANNFNTQELYQTTIDSADGYFDGGRILLNYKSSPHSYPLVAMKPVNGKVFCGTTGFSQFLSEVETAGFTFRPDSNLTYDYGFLNATCLSLGGGGSKQEQQPSFLIFVSQNKGLLKVMMTTGNPPVIISTPAIETALSKLAHPEDGIGNIICVNGQTFYELSFTQDNKTFYYNLSSKEWGTVTYLNGRNFVQATSYFTPNKKTYAISYLDAGLYELTEDLYTRNGYPQKYKWISRNFRIKGYKRFTVSRIVFWAKQGVGLPGNDIVQSKNYVFGSEPTITLSTSRDGGESWLPNQELSVGGVGMREYITTASQIGDFQTFTMKLEMTSPVPLYIVGVEIYYTPHGGT